MSFFARCCAGAGVLVTTHHSSASPRCICEHSNDLQTNVESHVLESMACADVLHEFVAETLSPGIRAWWPAAASLREAGWRGGRADAIRPWEPAGCLNRACWGKGVFKQRPAAGGADGPAGDALKVWGGGRGAAAGGAGRVFKQSVLGKGGV